MLRSTEPPSLKTKGPVVQHTGGSDVASWHGLMVSVDGKIPPSELIQKIILQRKHQFSWFISELFGSVN